MSAREPTGTYGYAAVGVQDKLYIWAGYRNVKTSTLETFNVSALKWEQPRQLNGSIPDGLWNAAVTSDGECAYTHGGLLSDSTRLNSLHEINTRTLQCRKLLPNSSSHAPQKTHGCCMVYFRKKLVVYGGIAKQTCTNDLHVFDLDTSEYGSINLYSRIGSGA